MSAAYDPTLPLGGAITYCVYKLFSKRKNRSPDGEAEVYLVVL